MPWSRIRPDPILRVSPSRTDTTPEIPALTAVAATRARERKGAARTDPKRWRASRRIARPSVGCHMEADSSSGQTIPERDDSVRALRILHHRRHRALPTVPVRCAMHSHRTRRARVRRSPALRDPPEGCSSGAAWLDSWLGSAQPVRGFRPCQGGFPASAARAVPYHRPAPIHLAASGILAVSEGCRSCPAEEGGSAARGRSRRLHAVPGSACSSLDSSGAKLRVRRQGEREPGAGGLALEELPVGGDSAATARAFHPPSRGHPCTGRRCGWACATGSPRRARGRAAGSSAPPPRGRRRSTTPAPGRTSVAPRPNGSRRRGRRSRDRSRSGRRYSSSRLPLPSSWREEWTRPPYRGTVRS